MIVKKVRKVIIRLNGLPKTDHKPYLSILFEMVSWVFSSRGGINDYFDYELFIKGKRPGDYVKSVQFNRIEQELNSPEYHPILEDKYFFYQILKGQGFRIPRNLYLIDNPGIFNLESGKYITEKEFLQNDFTGFCKLINGFGGKMIYRIEVSNGDLYLNTNRIPVSEFLAFLGDEKFLVQEGVLQHIDMQSLNPSCLNTIRMLTIRTGEVFHLYQSYLRVGINNNFVDNSLSGNIMVGIDGRTGTLMEHAYSDGIDSPQYKMEKHPQTGTVFKEFRIPFYAESVEMAKSLHLLFRQFFMIGWDIGITTDGPIVLEGNNIKEIYPYQVIYRGLKASFFKLAGEYKSQL